MTVLHELRRCGRLFAHSPLIFTGVLLAGVLGIGAATVVFGLLDDLSGTGTMAVDGGDVDARLRAVLWMVRLNGLAVFVCAAVTVVTLLSSQSDARRRDLAIRVSLGASGWGLTRPVLVEGVLLSVLASAGGVVSAFWTVEALPSLFYEGDVATLPIAVSPAAMLGAVLVGSTLILGATLVPRLGAARARATAIRRGAVTPGARRATRRLLALQVSISGIVLLSLPVTQLRLEAALRTATAHRLGDVTVWAIEPATRVANLGAMRQVAQALEARLDDGLLGLWQTQPGASRPTVRYVIDAPEELTTATLRTVQFDPLDRRRRTLTVVDGRSFSGGDQPGTCAVAAVSAPVAAGLFHDDALGRVMVPASGRPVVVVGVFRSTGPADVFLAPGQQLRADGHEDHEAWRVPQSSAPRATIDLALTAVTLASFEGLGGVLVGGRLPDSSAELVRCPEAVINEAAAARLGGAAALGKALISPRGQRLDIVGIVSETPLRTLIANPHPTVFQSLTREMPFNYYAFVRPDVEDALVAGVVSGVSGVRANRLGSLQQQLAMRAPAADRVMTTLVAAFTVLAAVLALIGVIATAAESAARRRAEFALRLALGGQPYQVIRPVVLECLGVVAVGAAIAASVVSVTALLTEPTPGIPATAGPVGWAGAALLLLVIGVVGSIAPARRACRVNPAVLLRD
jgi:hypothetical protein